MKVVPYSPIGHEEVFDGYKEVDLDRSSPRLSESLWNGMGAAIALAEDITAEFDRFANTPDPEVVAPTWMTGEVPMRFHKEIYRQQKSTLEPGLDPEEWENRMRNLRMNEALLKVRQEAAAAEHQKFLDSGLTEEQYWRKKEVEKLDDIFRYDPTGVLAGIGQGAVSLGGQATSMLARLEGFDYLLGTSSDDVNRTLGELESQLTINDEGIENDTPIRSFAKKAVRRATKSTVEMAPGAFTGGMPAVIAQASTVSANEGYTQGIDAGLTGSQAAAYGVALGAIDGAFTWLSGKIGGPSAEEMMSAVGGRGAAANITKIGVKDTVKGILHEAGEEQAITFAQAIVDRISGVDPEALNPGRLIPELLETGAAGGVGAGQARILLGISRTEDLIKQIETMKEAEQASGFFGGLESIVKSSELAAAMKADGTISRNKFAKITGIENTSNEFRTHYLQGIEAKEDLQRANEAAAAADLQNVIDDDLKMAADQELEVAADSPQGQPDLSPTDQGPPPDLDYGPLADHVAKFLRPVEPADTRLYRAGNGNFTDSLPDALSNHRDGELQYIDIPTAELGNYRLSDSATEFSFPEEITELATRIASPREQGWANAPSDPADGLLDMTPTRHRTASGVSQYLQAPDGTPLTDPSGRPIDQIHPVRTVEMYDFATSLFATVKAGMYKGKTWWGVFTSKHADPNTRHIFINRIMGLNPEQMKRTLAHEIGHFIAYLPDSIINKGPKILGHLAGINQFIGDALNGLTEIQAFEQARDISWWWRPFDQAMAAKYDPKFLAYRQNVKEITADVFSVFLNSPGDLQTRAPELFNLIMQEFSRRPEARKKYLELQSLIQGQNNELARRRRLGIEKMFEKGDEQIIVGMEMDRRARNSPLETIAQQGLWAGIDQFANELVPKFQAAFFNRGAEAIHAQWLAGNVPKLLSPALGANTLFLLEKLSRLQGRTFAWLQRVGERIVKPLQEAGLNTHDIGAYLMHRRIINDRGKFLNPKAYIPEESSKDIDAMRQDLGDEKFNVLRQAADTFYDMVFEVSQIAVDNHFYSQKNFDELIVPNSDSYAAFGVLEWLDNHVSAGIQPMVGTFEEIGNPFYVTVLKMVSTLHAANINGSKLQMFNGHLARDNPEGMAVVLPKDVIGQATVKRRLKDHFPRLLRFTVNQSTRARKSDSRYGTTTVLVDGYPVELQVPKHYTELYSRPEWSQDQQLKAFFNSVTYGIFYRLYINYNPSFALRNPIRDIGGTYVRLGSAIASKKGAKPLTLAEIIWRMWQNMPNAHRHAKGEFDPKMNEMMESGALDIPYTRRGRFEDTGLIDPEYVKELSQRAGLIPQDEARTWIQRGFNALERLGNTRLQYFLPPYWIDRMEAASKAAGYDALKARNFTDDQILFMVANFVGTPNTRFKGTKSDWTNAASMFFSTRMANIRAHALAMKLSPTEYAKRMPFMLAAEMSISVMARAGVFGAYVATMMALIPEDEEDRNYVLPLFLKDDPEDGETKVVYLALPRDQTNAFGRTLMRRLYQAGFENKEFETSEVMRDLRAESIGTWSPPVDITKTWLSYAMGNQPFDSYFHRPIVTDTEMRAGGWASHRKMIAWTIGKFGAIDDYLGFFTNRAFGESMNEGVDTWLETGFRNSLYLKGVLKITNRGHAQELFDRAAAMDDANDQVGVMVDAKSRRMGGEFDKLGDLKGELTDADKIRYVRLRMWYQGIYLPYRKGMRERLRLGDRESASTLANSLKNTSRTLEKMWSAMDRGDEQGVAAARKELESITVF